MYDFRTLLYTLAEHAYEYREEPFTLKSGKKSNHYVDARSIFLVPHNRQISGRIVASLMDMHGVYADAVAGVVLGGCPIADATSDVLSLPVVYVRPEPKDHGKGRQVEHPISKPSSVVLVEDVATTGGSLARAVAALNSVGIETKAAITIVDRQDGAAELLATYQVPFFAAFTLGQIVECRKKHNL